MSKRGRVKFLDTLHHDPPFADRHVTVVSCAQSWPDPICAELRARGALDECYVISTSSRWDTRTMQLPEAMNEICGYGDGTIVLFIPDRLAYYEGEANTEGDYQWIVERRD